MKGGDAADLFSDTLSLAFAFSFLFAVIHFRPSTPCPSRNIVCMCSGLLNMTLSLQEFDFGQHEEIQRYFI